MLLPKHLEILRIMPLSVNFSSITNLSSSPEADVSIMDTSKPLAIAPANFFKLSGNGHLDPGDTERTSCSFVAAYTSLPHRPT